MNYDILNKPVCCEVRKYNLKLLQKNLTVEELIDIEVLIKLNCPEAKLMKELYDKFCIEIDRDRKTLEFPTTQEE